MGLYYANAKKTLIFPFGLDLVGPPLMPDSGAAPTWHSRAWTLQEEAVAGDKAYFVLYYSKDLNPRYAHQNWSALREMYRREAAKEEDLVYSVLGFLGVTITPNAVRYGIFLRGAMLILADAVHVDQRLLLTVVESFHGNFIDGFSALPAFRDITAMPAPRLHHLRTLGVAEFSGHDGMRITAPAVVVDVEKIIDESNAINEALELPIQELVDVLEEKGSLDSYRFSRMTARGRQSSEGLAKIAPGTPSLGVTLIAVAQGETPDSDKSRKRGEPLVTFCCLVCTEGLS
ncbi:hypothetical protein H2201_004343 [Coniosporium apollinis]|uniref:Uncharacterized protein n=1 Tax=Coniosporium apollinis TaxID=61459 RepID=A0ABQ9NVH4_9PEZI|nr:hypothetical protein H2201_004343 [Coniosporium apollinis]